MKLGVCIPRYKELSHFNNKGAKAPAGSSRERNENQLLDIK